MDILNLFNFKTRQLQLLLGFYVSFVMVISWEKFPITVDSLFSVDALKVVLFSAIVFFTFHGLLAKGFSSVINLISKRYASYPLAVKMYNQLEKKYQDTSPFVLATKLKKPKIGDNPLSIVASDLIDSINTQIWFGTFFIASLQAEILHHKIYFLFCAILFFLLELLYTCNSASIFAYMLHDIRKTNPNNPTTVEQNPIKE